VALLAQWSERPAFITSCGKSPEGWGFESPVGRIFFLRFSSRVLLISNSSKIVHIKSFLIVRNINVVNMNNVAI
jgi:hypothetical protein